LGQLEGGDIFLTKNGSECERLFVRLLQQNGRQSGQQKNKIGNEHF